MTATAVRGLKGLNEFLAAFPKNLRNGAYRSGIRAAGNVIKDEARLRAPKRSGRMARAIVTGSPRVNQDGTVSVRVYVDENKPNGFLGYFHEYGVSPHLIASTAGGEGRAAVRAAAGGTGTLKGGKTIKIGDDFVSGIISHPGHAANPFMRPALDGKYREAVEAFRDQIIAYVEKRTGFNAGSAIGLDEAA